MRPTGILSDLSLLPPVDARGCVYLMALFTQLSRSDPTWAASGEGSVILLEVLRDDLRGLPDGLEERHQHDHHPNNPLGVAGGPVHLPDARQRANGVLHLPRPLLPRFARHVL
ncbi:hypothetical protein E2C01_075442 [Portunus trituberculatus]|uniref:Uncharacterized protein n=1 Tax=Portunus trituberculatus TaxID=210409 RepID=A0A5B7IG62_PORTR|nr:hypothetical protein [Portunus trituberculatus]